MSDDRDNEDDVSTSEPVEADTSSSSGPTELAADADPIGDAPAPAEDSDVEDEPAEAERVEDPVEDSDVEDPVEDEAPAEPDLVSVHPADRKLPPPPTMETVGRENTEPWSIPRIVRAIRTEGARDYVDARWKRWLRHVVVAIGIFVTAYVVYATFSWNRYNQPSVDTHFVYMAHTFNMCLDEVPPYDEECTLEMPVRPPHGNDWASYVQITAKGDEVLEGIWLDRKKHKFKTLDGSVYILKPQDLDHRKRQETRYFVSFPPGPAILMMPFLPDADSDEVDMRNPQKLGLNDVKFTIVFAALNVVLMFFLLQHLSRIGVSTRTWKENGFLTFLFSMGTNVLWCSVLGQVWFTALVIGITFTLLYILCAIDTRHPLLAGIFLAFAMMTRTPLAFSCVFFGYFLLFPNGRLRRTGWGEFFGKAALFSVPILIAGFFLMWMNQTRFGNPFEFGHSYLAQGQLRRIQVYGLFNYHFLSKNLHAAFTMLPRFQTYAPYVILSKHGMSLFLTTPPLLYLIAFRSGVRRLDRKWFWGLWATVAAVAIPGLFYQNTGWAQYGFRFSMDYTPYLILLLALNRRKIGPFFIVLALVGVCVNAFGAITFGRAGEIYQEWMIDPDR